MAMFVHLAPGGKARHIRRVGLTASRTRAGVRGIYAVPMLPSFDVTHQWLRELKRWTKARTMVAVDVRVPDDELVLVAHYARSFVEVRATEAVKIVMDADDPRGYEVIVQRGIRPGEIHRIRDVPQKVGWRYFPDAHRRAPCGCPACLQPGQPGARKIREAYERES
jgi:hypothetical protein